jgi:branched-chain amino acid transport system ATP-binding protein
VRRFDVETSAKLLDLTGLSRSFGAIVVADETLSIREGEAVGVIGPNGAGKTSLFNLISGDLSPSGGAIRLDGQDVTRLSARRRAHLGLARTYQIPHPFAGLTVFENLLVGAIHAHGASTQDAHRICGRVLDMTGLSDKANRLAGALTLLDRKRLELARALATQPRLLLLDEIAGGLTEAECNSLVGLIQDIHRAGTTIIWIEHIVHALVSVAQRLIVLNFGAVVADGAPREVMKLPKVRQIYLGSVADPVAAA